MNSPIVIIRRIYFEFAMLVTFYWGRKDAAVRSL